MNQSKKMLKVVGILYIVFSGIALISSIIGIAGLSAVIAYADLLGISVGMYVFSFIFSLILAALELTAGIFGVQGKKLNVCKIFGIVLLVLSAISLILNVVINAFNVIGVIGLAMPILYLIGAMQALKGANVADAAPQNE